MRWDRSSGLEKLFTARSVGEAGIGVHNRRRDYCIQRERYTNLEILKATDLELHDALEAWTERPELPLVPPFY
jgi:hypothetical protein